MNKAAVQKAKAKLQRMESLVFSMHSARSAPGIRDLWIDFIHVASVFYNALKAGSAETGMSKAWFGRKLHDRKTDPLLKYIYHARNSEQHGIAAIVREGNSNVTIHSQGAFVDMQDEGPFTWRAVSILGDVRFSHDRVQLIPVHDSGVTFDPPANHLGKDIECTPQNVAKLAFDYMDQMLKEAVDLAS